jgi:hypothetical protein
MTCKSFYYWPKLSMSRIHFPVFASYSGHFRLNLQKTLKKTLNPYTRKPPVETGDFSELDGEGLRLRVAVEAVPRGR